VNELLKRLNLVLEIDQVNIRLKDLPCEYDPYNVQFTWPKTHWTYETHFGEQLREYQNRSMFFGTSYNSYRQLSTALGGPSIAPYTPPVKPTLKQKIKNILTKKLW